MSRLLSMQEWNLQRSEGSKVALVLQYLQEQTATARSTSFH
jgi:hypothetical protein